MNDNCKILTTRGDDEFFIVELCKAILAQIKGLRLTTYTVRRFEIRFNRTELMWLRDRRLQRHWGFHKIARTAEALGIRVELSMYFDEDLKKAA